jgi:serine acetyltransferase
VSPNSVVLTDVPSGATVLGVPARVISREATSAYLKYPIMPVGPGAAKDSKPASPTSASTSGVS